MKTSLTSEQLYRLNDAITAVLAELGWLSRDDNDDTDLNDLVHDIAQTFFPLATEQ